MLQNEVSCNRVQYIRIADTANGYNGTRTHETV